MSLISCSANVRSHQLPTPTYQHTNHPPKPPQAFTTRQTSKNWHVWKKLRTFSDNDGPPELSVSFGRRTFGGSAASQVVSFLALHWRWDISHLKVVYHVVTSVHQLCVYSTYFLCVCGMCIYIYVCVFWNMMIECVYPLMMLEVSRPKSFELYWKMKVDSPVGGYFLPVVPPVSFLKKGMTNLRCPAPEGCKRLIFDLGQEIFH